MTKAALEGKSLFITGGTGSFGKAMTLRALEEGAKRVTIFSRDEWKQQQMHAELVTLDERYRSKVHFVLGCIRNKNRLEESIQSGDIVIHAAALKQVPAAEQNPTEFIQTNILGTQNVLEAARKVKAQAVLGLSTDKAVQPLNLYGATKLCAERLITTMTRETNKEMPCSVLRYGNVVGSRGSVLPIWLDCFCSGQKNLPVTSLEMTRFWITMGQAIDAVIWSLSQQTGGEIFVPKLAATTIEKLSTALQQILLQQQNYPMNIETIGIRAGEKIHETLIGSEESTYAFETDQYYILLPQHLKEQPCFEEKERYWSKNAKKIEVNLQYTSKKAPKMASLELENAIQEIAPFLRQKSSSTQKSPSVPR